jgi:mannan endo-1,4-beta-mannosidase
MGPGDASETTENALDQTPRGRLVRDLKATMESGRFLFGQERFNITGVNPDGTQWIASDTSFARSDAASLTGSHPAVLGMDVWDFADKPSNWTPSPPLNAQAARDVLGRNGVVTMAWHMRGCSSSDDSGSGFGGKGNEGCLCKLANDEAFAQSFLDDTKLKRFADTLEREGLADAPIIFRPLHENTADWFWWGPKYWNCGNNPITGAEAYKTVFRRIVDYLRVDRGLDNLLVAYASDRLDDASPEEQEALYLRAYPGDEYVDVLGIDLYYQWWSISQSNLTERYTRYLELVTRLARERGKIAALTETGNMRLAWELQPSWSRWFSEELLPMLRDNDRVAVAYAMAWENRTNSTEDFFVPYPGHPGVADFVEFFHDDSTLFLGDIREGIATAANGAPWCTSCTSDPDGDGWGWEAKRSCRIAPDCD